MLNGAPLVSCILPTRNRPAFLAQAVRGFLAQDHPDRELIVVDDGDDPMAVPIAGDERIRAFRLDRRYTLGDKRNFACQQARGSIVAHLDDDDWYPPHRLAAQVRALGDSGAAITGTSALYFFDPVAERAWLYSYPTPGWVAGASLVYRRAYWQRHPFPPVTVGEDWRFLATVTQPDDLADLADPGLCLATVHRGNTSPRRVTGSCWLPVDYREVARRLGSDAGAYRAAARSLAADASAAQGDQRQ